MTARNHPYPPLLPILPVYPNAYANLNTPSPRFSSLSMTEGGVVVSREMCVYIYTRARKGRIFLRVALFRKSDKSTGSKIEFDVCTRVQAR